MNSETKDKYVLKNNTGSLWHDNQTQIVRKGKVNIEDHERYASVIRFTDTQGNEKYELAISVGLLHVNPPETKRKPESPDISGKISFNGVEYKFGGWANQTDSGKEFTKVKLTKTEDYRPVKDSNTIKAQF